MKFTDRALRAIKPPKTGRVDIWDESLPGFGVRVSHTGYRSFVVMYRVRGSGDRKRRMDLGDLKTNALSNTRERARDVLRLAKDGRDPAAERQTRRKAITFAELADQYIDRHAKPYKRTWKVDRSLLNRHFVPAFGQRKAHDVTRQDARVVIDDIVAAGHGVMANRVISLIRRVYSWAVDSDILADNPLAGLKVDQRRETARERVLADDEIKTLWPALETATMSQSARMVLRLLLVTGQRRQEVAGMTWAEIDFDERLWSIPAERMKAKRAHLVPLSDMAMGLLEQAREFAGDSEFVFPSPLGAGKRPIKASSITNAWCVNVMAPPSDPLGQPAIPLDNARVHDLRRTVSTNLRKLGVPQFVVGQILGHAPSGVTARNYDRWDALPEKRAALDRWADHLVAIIEGREKQVIALADRKANA